MTGALEVCVCGGLLLADPVRPGSCCGIGGGTVWRLFSMQAPPSPGSQIAMAPVPAHQPRTELARPTAAAQAT